MRGNRRYVMARTARRTVEPDDQSSLPSVDTAFLRKLIKSGDTNFVDDLVGKDHAQANDEGNDYNSKLARPQRRWPYVLLGMTLMYSLIYLWESSRTIGWWKTYMGSLKSSQSTMYDSLGTSYSGSYSSTSPLRGGAKQDYAALNNPTQNSFYKTPAWQQGSSSGGTTGNNAMLSSAMQPQVTGGMSSGTFQGNSSPQYGASNSQLQVTGGMSRGLNNQQFPASNSQPAFKYGTGSSTGKYAPTTATTTATTTGFGSVGGGNAVAGGYNNNNNNMAQSTYMAPKSLFGSSSTSSVSPQQGGSQIVYADQAQTSFGNKERQYGNKIGDFGD